MNPNRRSHDRRWPLGNVARAFLLPLCAALHAVSPPNLQALPKRLVLALDGVAYRDMKALQEGVTYKDSHGRQLHRQAFNEGYFPVSRNVSTFPSASDVAWTDILGDRPLPGYQRIYFSAAANAEVFGNCLTSSVEYESQMNCQVDSGYLRALGYAVPRHIFKYEVRELFNSFLQCTNTSDTYYAYLRSTDDAQHLSADIFAVLCALDEKLKELCVLYRAREGRELEILILSDHGNNHAGAGHRVEVHPFLRKAGYRISQSIASAKDVVLPTAGIESWVEIHNAPEETENLLRLLWHLRGVDLITARLPGNANRFVVVNSKGERASIDWDAEKNSFRYSPETGDPINYRPVLEALSQNNQLAPDGFASTDAWMAETLTHRYPLALERIARGLTRVTLNPATILISLSNDFVHTSWLLKKGADLARFGGTHGGLDDLNSNGILLSNFSPTTDTSTSRLAALFQGFPGLRDYRAQTTGAEWICRDEQVLARIAHSPLDRDWENLAAHGVFLRIWTPAFLGLSGNAGVALKFERVRRFQPARVRRADPLPARSSEQRLTLPASLCLPSHCAYERTYPFPAQLVLEPRKVYRLSGQIDAGANDLRTFTIEFRTDDLGLPVPY